LYVDKIFFKFYVIEKIDSKARFNLNNCNLTTFFIKIDKDKDIDEEVCNKHLISIFKKKTNNFKSLEEFSFDVEEKNYSRILFSIAKNFHQIENYKKFLSTDDNKVCLGDLNNVINTFYK